MNGWRKLYENKNLLVGLVLFLLVVTLVQGLFLVKLYRSTDHDTAAREFSKELDQEFGANKDFLKRFNPQEWDPYQEFRSMREQMDRMFDDSFNRFRLSPFFDEGTGDTGAFLPQTDLIEEKSRYVVKMDIPGSDQAEIQVNLSGQTLSVRAKSHLAQKERQGDTFLRMERSMGVIERSIPLPGPVDADAMESTYQDGVLTIVLPKRQ